MNDPGTLATRVAPSERFRLAVTIRAEHPEIFHAVVVPDAVAVIELDGQGLAEPRIQAALLTDVLEYTSLDQASFDGQATAVNPNAAIHAAGRCPRRTTPEPHPNRSVFSPAQRTGVGATAMAHRSKAGFQRLRYDK